LKEKTNPEGTGCSIGGEGREGFGLQRLWPRGKKGKAPQRKKKGGLFLEEKRVRLKKNQMKSKKENRCRPDGKGRN